MEPRWNTLDQIARAKLIGQVRCQTRGSALATAEALIDGGILVIEVVSTTPEAYRIIEELNSEYGDRVLVGAGNLTAAEQVDKASDSGADFLTSPGCDADFVSIMQQTKLVVVPGVFTPSEVMLATFMGADAVRLFPGSMLGAGYLQTLRRAFPTTSVLATEDVSLENVKGWFMEGAAAVAVGDILCSEDMKHGGRKGMVERVEKLVQTLHEK